MSIWPATANLAVRAVRMELRIYESLWRLIARRPLIAPGAVGFMYYRPVLTILIIFIALSAIEIPIIDAIVHRWAPVRIGFLILGFWGLTWMIGLLCAYFTRPHTVGSAGLRIREGLEIDIPISWQEFASIRFELLRQESIDPTSTDKPGRVFDFKGERVCAIWIGSETNLAVTLERPTPVTLPGLHPKGGTHTVDIIRFWTDDPEAFLTSVQSFLGTHEEPPKI